MVALFQLIITKALALSMSKILGEIIHENQTIERLFWFFLFACLILNFCLLVSYSIKNEVIMLNPVMNLV